ncbi:MAG: GNAT family protein [Anaerolineae bacterium]
MKLIYGARTALRRFEERMTDAEVSRLYKWGRDADVLRWSGGSPTELSEYDFGEHIRAERLYGPTNRRAYLIFAREPHNHLELIGRLGIFGIDWDKRQGELGIVIGEKNYWGRGYGRDAVHTLVHHIFTTSSLNRVYLYTFADNYRAQHAFTAAGFREVSRGKRYTPDIGEFDGIEMQVTRADFEEGLFSPAAQTPHTAE